MPTKQEKRRIVVVNKPSPVIGYKPINQEYNTEYSKQKQAEEVYSGLLWHNKDSSKAEYSLVVRDNLAGVLYLKISKDETAKALKGFVGKPVHVLGKSVLENKINALLVKEVRLCDGNCNIFNL